MSAIELEPFYNEAEMALSDDFVLRLVIDMGVIDRLELLLGKRMDDVLGGMMNSTGLMIKVLWGVTRPHHNDLSMAQIAGILLPKDPAKRGVAEAVSATLGDLIRRTFHVGTDGEGEQSRPPRKRSSGASRASARSGSRPASIRTASGRKPRARS